MEFMKNMNMEMVAVGCVCVKPCVCVCCVVWKIEFVSCNVLFVVVLNRKHGRIHGKYGCCSVAEWCVG